MIRKGICFYILTYRNIPACLHAFIDITLCTWVNYGFGLPQALLSLRCWIGLIFFHTAFSIYLYAFIWFSFKRLEGSLYSQLRQNYPQEAILIARHYSFLIYRRGNIYLNAKGAIADLCLMIVQVFPVLKIVVSYTADHK